nr:protein PLASTID TRANSCRIPTIONALLY ACTIVE 12 [Ipomoea batatas]
MFRLEGKVALITGGASGIGKATTKLFSRHGAKVVIADIQDDLGRKFCGELEPGSAAFVHCDVTKEADVENAVNTAVTKFGNLDIMHNNAGIGGLNKPSILDSDKTEFEQVVRTNLVGAFLGTKHAARVMIPKRRGSIITTGSGCTVIAGASTHAYTSSKHAVVGLTRSAAVDLGRYGVRVNCVSPHLVATPLACGFYDFSGEELEKVYSAFGGERLTAEDVAEAALFLASDESRYIAYYILQCNKICNPIAGSGVNYRGPRNMVSVEGVGARRVRCQNLKTSFTGSFPVSVWQLRVVLNYPVKKSLLLPSIKCTSEDKEKKQDSFEQVSVERYPYYSYLDSTSGQLEPASGARASIPGQEYWPEGTASRVRAARAPEPPGVSTGTPSYGKNPGSRRKKHKVSAATSESSVTDVIADNLVELETSDAASDGPKDLSSEYVVYQTEPEEEELTEYELDKRVGNPHPFVDPKKIVDLLPLSSLNSKELLLFMGSGVSKSYGRDWASKALWLQAEQDRLEKDGPIAYYSEWVKAWKRDTSREAIQKHFEETGEDENKQLIEMFCHQTDREYRIMIGTDNLWGGDPVYPTINYIQDPNEVIDFRGPDFHEPTPDMLAYLKEHRKIITRAELDAVLAKEKTEEIEYTDMDEAMAQAVDIGENDIHLLNLQDEEESEVEEEKISRNWSVLKSNPELRKTKPKPKKENMSLDEAIDDSENLTDFLMDFEGDE